MGAPLKKLTIEGFKSIRSLRDFEMRQLNVLIGANGAGKSNLVDFFRLLEAMVIEGLSKFTLSKGGADNLLFNGPKETPVIFAEMFFGSNGYGFTLEPTASEVFMVSSESTFYDGQPGWRKLTSATNESRLKSWANNRSRHFPSSLGVKGHIHSAISSWRVYHFHDTSSIAPVRRASQIQDKYRLAGDGGNIAAVLHSLKMAHPLVYERIVQTIRSVAPYFGDFILEPEERGDLTVIRLLWRQKDSVFPFTAAHFSDGTIRFIALVTALLQPEIPATIVIDEPELGLHPFALDVLAGLFNEVALKTQIVISTQSVPLINNFEPEDVIVVGRDGNASTFRRLEEEKLRAWLEDYSLGELWQKDVLEGGPVYA